MAADSLLPKLFFCFLFIFVHFPDLTSSGVVVFSRDDASWIVEEPRSGVWLVDRSGSGEFVNRLMSARQQQNQIDVQETEPDEEEPDGGVDEMTSDKPLDWASGSSNHSGAAASSGVWTWQQQTLVTVVVTVVGVIAVTILVLVWLKTQMSGGEKQQSEPEAEPARPSAAPQVRVSVAPVDTARKQCIIHPTILPQTNTETVQTDVCVKVKGLLERRGSSASLTIDLMSGEPTSIVTPTTECSVEEFLLSSGRVLSRTQLSDILRDPPALHREFWELPLNHPEAPCVAGCGHKNRYRSILPNEKTRVKLQGQDEYVNANYIKCISHRQYIATQGPLENTVSDFFLMIWQQRSPSVVMVTRLTEQGRVKCERYLPREVGEEELRGEVAVKLVAARREGGHTRRILKLTVGEESRHVVHFSYETWPDHKTPAAVRDLLILAQEVEAVTSNPSPSWRLPTTPGEPSLLSTPCSTPGSCFPMPCPLQTNQYPPSPLVANEKPLSPLLANQNPPSPLLPNQSPSSPLLTSQSQALPLLTDPNPPSPLLTNQSPQSPLLTNQSPQSPLLTNQGPPPLLINQGPPPLLINQSPQSPLLTNQGPPPLLINQSPQSPLLTNPSPQSPLLTNQSPQSPHLTNQSPQSPLLTNQGPQSPLFTNQSPQSPLLTNQSPQSPFLTNQNPSSPILTNQSLQSPILTNQSPQSPLLTNQSPQSPLLTNQIPASPLVTNSNPTTPLLTNQIPASPLLTKQHSSPLLTQTSPRTPVSTHTIVPAASPCLTPLANQLQASLRCSSPQVSAANQTRDVFTWSPKLEEQTPSPKKVFDWSPTQMHGTEWSPRSPQASSFPKLQEARSPKKAFDFSPKQIQPSDWSPKSPRPAFDWSPEVRERQDWSAGKKKHFSFEPRAVGLVEDNVSHDSSERLSQYDEKRLWSVSSEDCNVDERKPLDTRLSTVDDGVCENGTEGSSPECADSKRRDSYGGAEGPLSPRGMELRLDNEEGGNVGGVASSNRSEGDSPDSAWLPSPGLTGPVVVHCSAGIGRTGCFIAVSTGIQQLLKEDCVDVLGIVAQMRADRGGMIQTAEQYEFIHRALHMFEKSMPPRQ